MMNDLSAFEEDLKKSFYKLSNRLAKKYGVSLPSGAHAFFQHNLKDGHFTLKRTFFYLQVNLFNNDSI